MPGRLFLTRPMSEVAAWFGVGPGPNDAARHNIASGQEVTVLTSGGLTRARWGIIPVGRINARGRPVMETIINARSETVFDKTAFDGVTRTVIPADGWYEWTGKVRRKTAWRIRPKDGSLLAFAAIHDVWRAPGGQVVAQVATVTCPPSADVAEIHDRMGVLLGPADVQTWLNGTPEDATELMQPWPAGRLLVEKAMGVDWTQA